MNNTIWHHHVIEKNERAILSGHRPCILWFTGLSGSGKSTIAGAVEERLFAMKIRTYLLDGDNIRHGLCRDLGLSDADRIENIRRIGEVAKLFVDAGIIVLCAFISPFRDSRKMVRDLVEDNEFIEIYIDSPLEICEQRDPKGLYKKVRKGEIKGFTGIDAPYEPPTNPEIYLHNGSANLEEIVDELISYLQSHLIIPMKPVILSSMDKKECFQK